MKLNEKMKAVESLKISKSGDEPNFDIAVRKYNNRDERHAFQVAIFGDGFEASRNLTAGDLQDIRDWIDAALSVALTS